MSPRQHKNTAKPKTGVEHSTIPGNHENQSFSEILAGLRRCAHTVPVRAGPAKIRAGPCWSTPHYSKIRAGSNRAGSIKT